MKISFSIIYSIQRFVFFNLDGPYFKNKENFSSLSTQKDEETIKELSSQIIKFGGKPKVDDKDLRETGHTKSVKNLVIQQAKLAKKANLDALVCSAHEVPYVKKIFKKEIITPGIRLIGDKAKDQKRIVTPKKAFENGASSIVIGRSITKGNIIKNIDKLIKSLN